VTVGVLLLAAGSSRRFGSDKRFATLSTGVTLLDAAIENCLVTDLPLRVCVGSEDHDLVARLARRGLDVMVCPRSSQGMGATLADAVAGIRDWTAALVALGDMPMILPATISLIARHAAPDRICVPMCDERAGHPVAFGAAFFEKLSQCEGDRGARWIIESHSESVDSVPVDDPGIHRDVDTPEALRQL
jgi:molybdenum cofactor cytidylyltransferase